MSMTDKIERFATGHGAIFGLAIAMGLLGTATLHYPAGLLFRDALVVLAWGASVAGLGAAFVLRDRLHLLVVQKFTGIVLMIYGVMRSAAFFHRTIVTDGDSISPWGVTLHAATAWSWWVVFFAGLILWGFARRYLRENRGLDRHEA